ncbi:23S rRNA pseudouridine1911/1915/1917 synthase [Pilibacter termitis]|uniref:Pseudouridine synthase n=1 Tax=Pilibacter termitis TaxID=263852 RepID=A0A1T4L9Z6_9ENTE|nr:RluA family pseudouridine synthase [Pilibacter termitis]SJZ51569.1 23S rRNA pseudouridine1911/1915/1917 synthase [Pilibacter termitis]
MEFQIQLPDTFQTMDIRTLLEREWLVPRKTRHFLRIRKGVLVNGDVKMFHEEVKSADIVTLKLEKSDYPKVSVLCGNQRFVEVLYEDEHILVVNKPFGMKTHPNQPNETNTLLNHVADYLAKDNQVPYVVHRLDKETSGAILFAKNPFILPILSRMLEKKELHRVYQAIASGIIHKNEFTIDKKIGRDRHDRRKRVIDERGGKRAITHVRLVEVDKQTNTSKLELILDTGRTHQIRVHLQSIHHAIIGDPLYAEKFTSRRLMLHARELSFIHPFTKEQLIIQTNDTLF